MHKSITLEPLCRYCCGYVALSLPIACCPHLVELGEAHIETPRPPPPPHPTTATFLLPLQLPFADLRATDALTVATAESPSCKRT